MKDCHHSYSINKPEHSSTHILVESDLINMLICSIKKSMCELENILIVNRFCDNEEEGFSNEKLWGGFVFGVVPQPKKSQDNC